MDRPTWFLLIGVMLIFTSVFSYAAGKRYEKPQYLMPLATPTAVVLEATPTPVAVLHCAEGETVCMAPDEVLTLTYRVWCCIYEPRKWAEEVQPKEGKR